MAQMHYKLTLLGATMALGVGFTLPVSADIVDGFSVDSSSTFVMDSYGKCIRTPRWNDDIRVVPCTAAPEPPAPVDSDGDGVSDKRDRCPGTAPGAKVNMIGCAIKVVLDSDNDGVNDDIDRCPNTPAGAQVNEVGCELDDDADGVVNSADQCAGTPAGVRVNGKGCEIIQKIVLRDIQFARDSTNIAGSIKPLYNAAHKLKKHNDRISSMVVTGHTDSTGSMAYNQRLSRQRAQAVANYLSEQGVPASKITVRGMGERQPIADNRTAAGRKANRRVEIDVVMAD